jgi:hypothetical protein
MNKEGIPRKVLNATVIGKRQRDRDQHGNNRSGNISHRGREEDWKEMSNCRKTETDGEAWLSNGPNKVEMP